MDSRGYAVSRSQVIGNGLRESRFWGGKCCDRLPRSMLEGDADPTPALRFAPRALDSDSPSSSTPHPVHDTLRPIFHNNLTSSLFHQQPHLFLDNRTGIEGPVPPRRNLILANSTHISGVETAGCFRPSIPANFQSATIDAISGLPLMSTDTPIQPLGLDSCPQGQFSNGLPHGMQLSPHGGVPTVHATHGHFIARHQGGSMGHLAPGPSQAWGTPNTLPIVYRVGDTSHAQDQANYKRTSHSQLAQHNTLNLGNHTDTHRQSTPQQFLHDRRNSESQ